jgi:hypothetical protein
LEQRNGRIYYYRSVRDGEKVRKVYEGAGELARIAAGRDLVNRAVREGKREQERAELKHLVQLQDRFWAMSCSAACEIVEWHGKSFVDVHKAALFIA